MVGGWISTSELVYLEPSRVARPSRVSFTVTSDTLATEVITKVLSLIVGNFSSDALFECSARPYPAKKGTAEGFRGSLHDVVPSLRKLSDEDLEKLIDVDETDASEDE